MEKNNEKYIWAGVFCLLCLGFLIFRTFLGIDMEDEAYHIASIVHVMQGKIPLMSIWDGHTGFFLLVPIIAVFRNISPDMEGVVLFYRLLCAIVHFIIYIFNIYELNKKYETKRFWLLFCPLATLIGTSGLHYNRASALLLITIGTLIHTSNSDSKEVFRYFIIGFLMGLVCLSYPSFSIIAIIMLFFVFIDNKNRYPYLRCLSYAIGVGIIGMSFFFWIMSKGSLGELSVAINAVLNAPHTAYRGPINMYFFYRTFVVSIGKFFLRPYILILILYVVGLNFFGYFEKKQKSAFSKDKMTICRIILYLLFVSASVLPNRTGYGYAVFGILIGYCLLHLSLKRGIDKKQIIYCLIIILYILIYSFTSDNKNVLLGFSASSPLIYFIVVLSLFDLVQEECSEKNALKVMLIVSMALMMVGVAHSYGNIYGDENFNHYGRDTQVKKGVFKGLFTTSERKEYLEELQMFVEDNVDSEDSLCVITLEPMIYFMTEAEIFTPQTFDAQYLFKGMRSSEPLVSYFEQYKKYPAVLIGTDKHNQDFISNPEYEIKDFINENYILTNEQHINDVTVWIWRLK